ncbi:hypothetical protein AVEN_41880-1 [Araneus ventricosus]|uniref:Uncharacterized protein n=1 Tax=Araneus ventricosus TaxID=182803 RepID=A0A4Y2AD25_ARAVE|nr:hypothetical protein AVEN_41880-1 [Araneus ventricosus]
MKKKLKSADWPSRHVGEREIWAQCQSLTLFMFTRTFLSLLSLLTLEPTEDYLLQSGGKKRRRRSGTNLLHVLAAPTWFPPAPIVMQKAAVGLVFPARRAVIGRSQEEKETVGFWPAVSFAISNTTESPSLTETRPPKLPQGCSLAPIRSSLYPTRNDFY